MIKEFLLCLILTIHIVHHNNGCNRWNNNTQIIQSRDNQLSQQAQSANLINTLRPTPIPAYMTCSPYMSNYYATNGLNCGCSSCGY